VAEQIAGKTNLLFFLQCIFPFQIRGQNFYPAFAGRFILCTRLPAGLVPLAQTRLPDGGQA